MLTQRNPSLDIQAGLPPQEYVNHFELVIAHTLGRRDRVVKSNTYDTVGLDLAVNKAMALALSGLRNVKWEHQVTSRPALLQHMLQMSR